MGAISIATEALRQERTGDKNFLARMPPIFELQVPAKAASGQTSFLFVLPMPPTEYEMEDLFTVEVTPAQDSGLVVEESGILQHRIRLSGTTGFRVRRLNASRFSRVKVPKVNSTKREILSKAYDDVSGHRYFEYLQDGPFRVYSDLKQDQELAEDTRLILHIPKDDEHFVVTPISFRLRRSKPRDTFLYWYEIELIGVALASAPETFAPAEQSILSRMLDTAQQIRNGLAIAREAFNDLNRLRAQIESEFRSIVGIVDDVGSILDAVNDFVTNTTDAIEIAQARVSSSIDEIEFQLGELDGSPPPDTVSNLFRAMSDALCALRAHPEAFERDVDARVSEFFSRGLGKSASSLSAAADSEGPTTFRALDALGSGLLPGDEARDEVLRRAPEEIRRYRSVLEVTVAPSDTIEGLAARFLGDARLWRYVAILNDLKAPYLSAAGLPGTIRPSEKILIPSAAPPPRATNTLAVLGAQPTDSVETRFLGTDFKVVELPGGFEDWAIDIDGGSVDLQSVTGVENLAQGLKARVETERGSDPMFQALGIRRVIGIGLTAADLVALEFRADEAVRADPRVAVVRDIRVRSGDPPDAAVTEIDVEVRGLESAVPVRARLPSIAGAPLT